MVKRHIQKADRTRSTPSRRQLDQLISTEIIVDHLEWVISHQGLGYFALRFFKETSSGERKLAESYFFSNSDKTWKAEVQTVLAELPLEQRHCFYSVQAFDRKIASASAVVPGRLAHVDGDNVPLPPSGPPPSRIIQTSANCFQFLYSLDRELSAKDLQAISRYLTTQAGGDRGGHSPSKLLRLPGTLNIKTKYTHPFAVEILP